MRKLLTCILILLVCSVWLAVLNVGTVKAETPIYIRSDGSVEGTDKIQRNGNVYTFTGDVFGRIDIQKSNIIVDGAGHAMIKSELDFAITVGTDGNVPEPFGVNGITVKNLQIIGFDYGITLSGENNIVQRVNVTDGKLSGVPIWVSGSNHTIRECRITDNAGYGMLLHATDTILYDNYIADNGDFGIRFYDRAVMLRNNILDNNGGGPFLIDEMRAQNQGEPFKFSSNDIDPSNLVDGKPVYCWVNEHNKTVPSDAGYVFLDNCTNINVKDLSINRNSDGRSYFLSSGISLIRTENSTISTNALNGTGVYISYSSKNILVANNQITSGGVISWGSNVSIVENFISDCMGSAVSAGGWSIEITRNTLTKCRKGIDLQSSQNKVTQNSIEACGIGINIFTSNNNTFHQNNFIDNNQTVNDQHYSFDWPPDTYYQSYNNTWDGNFWSNYDGIDIDGDGIGDTPYVIFESNQDNNPLMEPIIIPEFSSLIILPFLFAAMVAVLLYKKKLHKWQSY